MLIDKKRGVLAVILIFLLALLIFFYLNEPVSESGDTIVKSGSISEDETWKGKVHVIDDVIVEEGATLTIEPGTIVKFKHGNPYENYLEKNKRASLQVVGGKLKAIGTPDKPIWFTSDRETPINRDWGGIAFVESKDNEIKYAIVEYAEVAIELELHSSATISNSIIRWSHAGIYQEVYTDIIIEKNRIYGIGLEPIAFEEFTKGIVRNNEISDSNSGIVVVDSNAIIEDNIFSNNLGEGMEIFGVWGQSDATFSRNKITKNSGKMVQIGKDAKVRMISNELSDNEGGIECLDSDEVIFEKNAIFGNKGVIELINCKDVNLKNNWWGTVDEEKITEMIVSEDKVDLKPLLEENPVKINPIEFDYKDLKKTELGYIPGDPDDKYMHIFPEEDKTRKVVKRIGEKLGYVGVGWSLAWDGEALWTFAHDNNDLYKIDTDTGDIIKEFNIPGINRARGIAFDGEHLWANDFANLKVFEIDPENGEVVSEFPVPEKIGISQTIVWDGSHLYLSGYGEPKLFKVDKKGNILDTIKLEKGLATTITSTGDHWWTSGDDGALYKLSKDGKVAGMINDAAREPWAITWDGEHLWTLQRLHERWEYVPRMFKIKVLDDQVALKSQKGKAKENKELKEEIKIENGKNYKIHDAHTHIFSVENIEKMIRLMDENNVEKSVVFGDCEQNYYDHKIYASGYDESYNSHLAEAYKQYPERFYTCISGFDPQDSRAVEYVEGLIKTRNFKCIGEIYLIHETLPEYKSIANGEVMQAIWNLSSYYTTPVFIHYERWNQKDIEALYEMFDKYPDAKFVWLHLGEHNPYTLNALKDELIRFPNVYYETEEDIVESVSEFIEIFEKYSDRFLLGTDTGCNIDQGITTKNNNYSEAMSMHRKLLSQLSEESANNIAYKNFEQLFSD